MPAPPRAPSRLAAAVAHRARRPERASARAAAAAGVWLVAAALTLRLAPQLQRANVTFFAVAVLFAGWYGGVGGALLAAAASALAIDYFLVVPVHAVSPASTATLLAFGVFASAGAAVALLTRAADSRYRDSSEYARQLQSQTAELAVRAQDAHVLAAELAQANHELEAATIAAEVSRDHAHTERERLERVLDSLPDATNVFDRGWRWTYINPVARRWLRHLGRDPGALVGQCAWDEFPAVRTTKFYTESVRALAEGRIIEFEERTRVDGRLWWFENRVVPIGDGVVTYSRDVTARREIERKLRDDEARFRHIFVANPLPMWVADAATGAVLDVNEAAERAYGYSRAEFLAITPDRLATVPAPAAAADTEARQAVSHRTRDGTVLDVELSATRVDFAGRAAWLTLALDVTERNRAAARQQFLADATQLLAASLDPAGTLARLADLAVPTLADWCGVELVAADGTTEQLAVAHVDPARVEWARELRRRYPTPPDAPSGVPAVIRTGRSDYRAVITDEMLQAAARDSVHLELLRGVGFRSTIIAPLALPTGTVGAFTLVAAESGRRFTPADVLLAEELGRRAALALENARLYAAEQAARLAAEAAVARTARLQAVTAALSATLTPTEVARAVVEHGVAALGAQAGAVAALDESGDALVLLGAVGYAPEAVARYARIPLDADFPLAEAARLGAPIILRTPAERDAHYPALEALRQANGAGAMVAVPLTVEERRVGAIGINFPPSATLDADEERFILALAHQCAQSLDRARLYELERSARRTAERLQALTAALSGAATPEAVGAVVLEQGVRALGAHSGVVAVTTPDGESLEIIASTGYPPEACMGPGRRWPAQAAMPIAEAARTGAPVFVGSVEGWQQRYPAAHVPPRTGNAAWAALPVGSATAGSGGAVLWTFDESRAWGDRERALMETVARLCSQALERARLFAAERAAREEAQRQSAVAVDANRTKSEFLATMSHELRTPLNAIGGYAELLEMGIRGPVTDAQRQDLERIQRSQRHLLSLVNDVLNFARLDAGQVRYEIVDVDVPPLLAHVAALVGPQLAARHLRLATRCADATPPVRADRDKLAQILLNLLTNAIKFTPPGGQITASCEAAPDGAAPVVRLGVADTGIGIAAEHLESIFEPFVQVQSGLTRTVEGAGLGLAISRDLARAMGGDLTVATAPGAGSVFTVTMPAAVSGER